MKKSLLGIVVLCGLFGIGLAGFAFANGAIDGDAPAMMVSPSTIVLAKVDTITVHTNIVYAAVVEDSIDLDGIAPTSVFPDLCGDLVAKFAVAKLNLAPGLAELTLSGSFLNGSEFEATDAVWVK